jgi:hypothetical protein
MIAAPRSPPRRGKHMKGIDFSLIRGLDFAVVGGASIFLLLGAWLLVIGMRNLSHAVASPNWPRAAAVVVASQTSAHADPKTVGSRASSTMYEADIRFAYTVDGKEYATDILHFGQTYGSGDSSDAALRKLRYPLGREVTVAYKPDDPAIAAAEPGFDHEVLLLIGGALFFIMPAIMFIVTWFGMTRNNSAFAIGLDMFAGIFAAIGASLLAAGLVNLWRAQASLHWPQAPGLITYGKIDSSRAVLETDGGRTMSASVSGARLIYQYEVAGKRHYNNTRLFGQTAGGGRAPEDEIATRYPLGKSVPVFYAPYNADLATLEPGIKSEAFWLPGAGAAFFLFGLAVFIWGVPAITRDV